MGHLSRRVLLVEDNVVNAITANRLLTSLGFSTTVVGNGLDAVAACLAETFDAVIMDLEMPIMGGLQAAKRIRQLESGSRVRIPIVALTGSSSVGVRDCAAAGMDAFVLKPAKLASLKATLNVLLAQHVSEVDLRAHPAWKSTGALNT